MASLFESVTGTGSRGVDETIRGPTNNVRLPAASTSSGTSTAQPRSLPPHMSSTRLPGRTTDAMDVPGISRSQQDFLDAKLQLEQAKLVSQTASLINSRWDATKRLAADGSNFIRWLHELSEVGEAHMSNADFFISAIENSTFEKIARMVVLSSVHTSLVVDLQRLRTTLEMLSYLKRKFSVISRAAQINVWNRFMAFSVEDSDCVGLSSTMRNLYAEWNNLNVRISSDAFFGFVFQRAVMRSALPFKKDFEQRVENAMQNDPTKALPKFDALVNAFDVCKKQHEHSIESDGPAADNTAPSVLLANTKPEEFDFDAFLADVPEENWPDALDFYAATAHRCWQCGAPDHYLRECPHRAKPNQLNRRLRGPGFSPFQTPSHRTQATFVGSLYTQPSFQGSVSSTGRAPPPRKTKSKQNA